MNKFNSTCSFLVAYFSFFARRTSLIFLFISYVSSLKKKPLYTVPFMVKGTKILPWENIYFYVLQFNSLSSVIPSKVNFVNGISLFELLRIRLFNMVYYCSSVHEESSRKRELFMPKLWHVIYITVEKILSFKSKWILIISCVHFS